MVEVRRKKGESAESMMRRFTKKIKKSRVLVRAKKGRYYAPKVSENQRQVEALRKIRSHERYEYLKKIGKWEETTPYQKSAARRKSAGAHTNLPSSKERASYTAEKK